MIERGVAQYASTGLQGGSARLASNVWGSDQGQMRQYFQPSGVGEFSYKETFPKSNYTLGEVTKERQPILAQIIETWTLFENANVFTKILPFVRTDNLRLQYDKITFLPTIAQRTAERSLPRTVESKRMTIREVLERNAIGLEFNYAMLTTPEGQNYYQHALGQIRNAVDEGNALNILNELQTCFSPWRVFEDRYKNYRGRTMREIMEDERFYFGIFQREAGPFELLDTVIERKQQMYRGRGNTYIMPKELLMYVTQVPDRNKLYYLGGQEALDTYNQGPAGVTADGRGNVIVLVNCFMVDNQRPLDPLKSYVTYGEWNEFRDLKRGGNYRDHFDAERWMAIYNIDDDSWNTISTDYVIDNCCRFDEESGEPLGINHARVARHTIEYTPSEMRDSYHFLMKQANGKMDLMPCRYMGQISLESNTLKDIWTFAECAVEKMTDLHTTFATSKMKGVIDGGMEALRYIENLPYDDEANAWITHVRDENQAKYGLSRHGGPSAFASTFPTELFGQNHNSSWDLPTTALGGAWPNRHQLPFGFGHIGGFMSIADAYAEAGTPEKFAARYHFNGGMAKKVHRFVHFLQQYVSYCKQFFHESPAVDESYAMPWWLHPTAMHTLWDAVVGPQHRLPYHVRPNGRDRGAAATAVPASQAAVNLLGMSKQASRFLDDYLLGRTNTIEVVEQTRHIQAYLGAGVPTNKSVVFDPQQRVIVDEGRPESKAINLQNAAAANHLLERLPAFTRVFYRKYDGQNVAQASNTFFGPDAPPNSLFLANGLNVRVVTLDEGSYGNQPAMHKTVTMARDLLLALEYHTLQDELFVPPRVGPPRAIQSANVVSNEAIRALLLIAMATVRIGKDADSEDLAVQAAQAQRILDVYNMVIEPFLPKAVLMAPGALGTDRATGTLSHIPDPPLFINRFRDEAMRALRRSTPDNPFKYEVPERIDDTVEFMKRVLAKRDEAIAQMNRVDPGPGRSSQFSIQDYLPSPLVYSPKQLVTHYDWAFGTGAGNVVPVALMASTDSPIVPMSVVIEQSNARAVKAALANPSESTIKPLHASLIPDGIGMGAPIHHNSIVVHMQRERLISQDKIRSARQAAADSVGAPGRHPTPMDVDMQDVMLMDPIAPPMRHQVGGQRLTFQERMAVTDGVEPEGYIPSTGRKRVPARQGGRQVHGTTFSRAVHPDSYDRARDEQESDSKRLKSFAGIDTNLHDMLLTNNFVQAWKQVDRHTESTLIKWTSKLFLLCPFNSHVLKNWAHRDLMVPIRALIFRFCVLGTYSIIKEFFGYLISLKMHLIISCRSKQDSRPDAPGSGAKLHNPNSLTQYSQEQPLHLVRGRQAASLLLAVRLLH